jgi:hypothetical protein
MSDLSPQAQRIMQLTREALSPDEAAVEALRAALAARLGPLQPPAADGAETLAQGAASSATSVLLKLSIVALIAGTAALGLFAFGARTERVPAALRVVERSQPSAAASPASSTEPAAVLRPAAAAPAPLSPPRSAARTRASQRVAASAPRSNDVTQPRPVSAAVSVRPARAVQADDSLGPELALLRDARAALDRHEPLAALASLDQHALRYPHGTLQQERLAARALALCALGRTAAAAAAAGELTRVAPGSPYLARVRAGCKAEQSK